MIRVSQKNSSRITLPTGKAGSNDKTRSYCSTLGELLNGEGAALGGIEVVVEAPGALVFHRNRFTLPGGN